MGEKFTFELEHDPEPRTVEAPAAFVRALEAALAARAVFEELPPSRQLEIVRYLARLRGDPAAGPPLAHVGGR